MSVPLTTADYPLVPGAPGALGAESAGVSTRATDRTERDWSRAADYTAERLGMATLGYVAATTLVITLAPFRFTWPAHGLFTQWDAFDLIMNVVMFLPLGFLYRVTRPRGSSNAWYTAILVGALLSSCIEAAQLFEKTRYSSYFDVLTNTLGAAVGSLMFSLLSKRLQVNAKAVSTLALELPLMGLVYLLVPLVWLSGLAGAGTNRTWLLLPLAAFGGAILGAVHGGYMKPGQRAGTIGVVAASAAWYLVASLPGGRSNPEVIIAGTAVATAVAWLRSRATARARARRLQRRFELPTLRMVLPLFAGYLALSSLWPLGDASGVFRAGWSLFPAVDGELSQRQIFQALEFTAAFTLVGYIIAEFYGRRDDPYRAVFNRVVRWSALLVVLLELARGWHAEYGSSVLMAVMAMTASVFGGWLYHLQRDHVRALWARDRGHSSSFAGASSSDPSA